MNRPLWQRAKVWGAGCEGRRCPLTPQYFSSQKNSHFLLFVAKHHAAVICHVQVQINIRMAPVIRSIRELVRKDTKKKRDLKA